jgi:sugar/nucleoside kinase (ribokinase family)
MPAPEFVAVGHVTLDRFGDKIRPGGSAAYAAVTAHRLGLSAGILTSHGDDFPLDALPPQIEVITVPAASTTTFGHTLVKGARSMTVASAARPLTSSDVPEDWLDAPLVLLAPVLNEVDPLLAATFGAGTVAAAAQGWLRGLNGHQRVVPQPWASPESLLARVQALFLSREDIAGDEESARAWFERVPVGALTSGPAGATLFVNGEEYAVRPRPSREVDETGAGDVFAATFLVHYARDGDPWRAAAAAACAAALATEGEGWSAVPVEAALDRALADYGEEGE